jgi:hypothetical protein
MSSRGLDFAVDVLRPGGGLVVEGAGLQECVQDADQPVGELAQRGLVAGADPRTSQPSPRPQPDTA